MGLSSFDSKRVLIVEDNLILSMLEQRIVENLGFKVIGNVSSGEEAITTCKEIYPDCVLLDISLKGDIDGLTVLQSIRKQNKIPVLIITGNEMTNLHLVEPKKGYTEILVKPFLPRDLVVILKRMFQ